MRHIVVSKHFRKVYRLGDLDIIGKSHYEVFPDLPERWKKAHRRCLEGAVERADEDFFAHGDGSVDWTKWEIRPWYESDGGIGGIILFVEVITEQKLARDAQRESEERYRVLFENSPVSLWEEDFSAVKIKLDELKQAGVVDFEAYLSEHPETVKELASLVRILDVNETSVKMYGAKSKADLVRNFEMLLRTDDLAVQFRWELVHIANGVTYFERKEEDRNLSGGTLHTILTWSAMPGHEQDLSRVIISIGDVTERKQMENELRETRNFLATLLEIVPVSIYVNSMDDTVQLVNRQWELDTQIERGDAIGRKLSEIFPADLAKKFEAGNAQAAQSDVPLMLEEWAETSHGLRGYYTLKFPIRDANGRVDRIGGVSIDITGRKQAEEELRRSEEKLKNIIRHSSSMFYTHTAEHKLVYVSPQSREILDCEPEEAMVHWQEFLSDNPSNRQGVEATERALRTGERQPPYELELVTRKGRRIFVEVDESPIVRDGKVTAITGSVTDITKRKQAEQERERLLNTLEASLNEIYMFDVRSLKFEYVNASALHNLGYSFEQMKEMTPFDLKPEFTEDSFRKLLEPLQNGETQKLTFETLHRRADASLYPVEVHLQLVEHEGESVFLSIILNITERRRLIHELGERIKELTLLHDSTQMFMDASRPEEAVLQEVADFIPAAWQYPQIAAARVGYNGKQFTTPNYRETDWMQTQFFDLPNGDLGFIQLAYLEERPEADEGPFLKEERRLIELLADKLKTYLSGNLAAAAVKRHLSELETLYESGLAINRLLAPQEIAQAMITILQRRMDWHHIAIRQYHPETETVELIGFNKPGMNAEQVEEYNRRLQTMISKPTQGLSGWVTTHGVPVRVADLDRDVRYVRVFADIRSGMYVPLKIGDKVIGSISVESQTKNAFTEDDQRLLETLAAQAAVAIQNAGLFSELQAELIERRLIEEQMRQLNAELEQRVQDRTAQIESVKRRLELAAHAGQIGVWEYIPAENRVIWDERMHIIHHLEIGAFGGTPHDWADLIHPDDRSSTPLGEPAGLSERMFTSSEHRTLLPNGSARHLSVSALTVFGEDNKPERIIGICMDVTRNKQAEETLRLANAEMEAALRVKDEFLANMSHELRTPLNAILGISESLEEQIVGNLNEKQLKYVQTVHESGRHLLDLINDILDISKIEAGHMEL
ncbi:MAG TPA: PAS domain S-box protein, partial [Anaerolineales bacterium]|nr:PAS domain S-box protein [Anaerolineales bacterium]